MTGFGSGNVEKNGTKVKVEISAVNNRKQADIRMTMPRELAALENNFKKQIREKIVRGNLTVSLVYELNETDKKNQIKIDQVLAGSIIEQLKELADKQGIAANIDLTSLLEIPGVIIENNQICLEELEPIVIDAIELAVEALRAEQKREGEHLFNDLKEKEEKLQELLKAILEKEPEAVPTYQKLLQTRINTLGVEVTMDDERLAKEVAFFADRADISEELVRLQSHLDQYVTLLTADEPVGRQLEFLFQEVNREIGTLCAKTTDTELANYALEFKTVVGTVREQVLNVE